jgi:hypothetical protein
MIPSSLNKRNIIMCSQCYEEFPTGYDYRIHWEKKHFYPYLKSGKFDDKKAMKDAERDKHIGRLIREISNNI